MNSEHWTSLSAHHKAFAICMFFVIIAFFSNPITAEAGSANVYHQHQNLEKKIALTFDDGPHPILTPRILSILEKYQIKATFFIVGENAKNYPLVVEQILNQGHEIGNHTYTHDNISKQEFEIGILNLAFLVVLYVHKTNKAKSNVINNFKNIHSLLKTKKSFAKLNPKSDTKK